MGNPLPSLKVLIADDHFLIRQLVCNVLSGVQITDVHTATDGTEAIELIQEAFEAREPFHIVFLDWHMPKLSGFEVLSYFRAKPEYANTAFVMLSAETERKNIMKALASGATSYIAKPVSSAAFIKKLSEIHKWIDQRHNNTHH